MFHVYLFICCFVLITACDFMSFGKCVHAQLPKAVSHKFDKKLIACLLNLSNPTFGECTQTRIQSTAGFWKAGGFKGIYNGLGAAAIGSAPCAALFFCSYDFVSSAFLNQIKRRRIEDRRVSIILCRTPSRTLT